MVQLLRVSGEAETNNLILNLKSSTVYRDNSHCACLVMIIIKIKDLKKKKDFSEPCPGTWNHC